MPCEAIDIPAFSNPVALWHCKIQHKIVHIAGILINSVKHSLQIIFLHHTGLNILLYSIKNIRSNFSVKALIQHIYIFIIILLCRAIDKGNICRITLHYSINNILWFIFLRHNRLTLLMWIKIIRCMIYTVDLFSIF